MSKEMRMAELIYRADRYLSKIDDLLSINERKVILLVINDYQRVVEENAALREALRLKEAECEALAGDKSKLLLSLNETVHALADICGANGIKGKDDFVCEIEDFIVEMVTNENQQAD